MRSNDLRCKSYQPIQANTMKGPILGCHPMGHRQRPHQNITLSNKINAKAAFFCISSSPGSRIKLCHKKTYSYASTWVILYS